MQSPINGERGTEYIATTNQKKELRNKGRDWIEQSDTGRRLIFRLGVIFSGKKIALSLLLRGWGGGGPFGWILGTWRNHITVRCILSDAHEKNIIKMKDKKCDHANLKKKIERSNHGQKRIRVDNSGKTHWRV